MHITLIRPQMGSGRAGGYNSPARMEPTALAILAALTPREHELVAHDERFEPIPFEAPTDLVALSVDTFAAKRAYEIAACYRKRGVRVVMGGFHPTLLPKEALLHADAVARGDAEGVWPRILADAEGGRLQRLYEPEAPAPVAAIIPDRSIFANKRYLPLRMVQYARGCSRSCEFCSVRAFYGGSYRYRPVEEVVCELRQGKERRVFFTDDNIISNKNRFRELLEAILPLGLRWTTQIDLSFADDDELLRLAARSGCQSVVIGFESLEERNLALMNKSWNRVSLYAERLARIRRAGIMVYGTFVLGYDHDTPEVFRKTLDFAQREKLFIANFNPLQPLPGTGLHERLRREGRLLYENWWLDERYRWHNALFSPRGMTPEELARGCAWCREKFNSVPSIARRFLASSAHRRSLDNAAVFLASNAISRLDIRAKSGLHLGKEEASAP